MGNAARRYDEDEDETRGHVVSLPSGAYRSWTLRAQQHVSFVIKRSPGLLDISNGDLLRMGPLTRTRRRIVVIDDTVERLYGDRVRRYFDHHHVSCAFVTVAAGEVNKSTDTLFEILGAMESFGMLRRSEPLLAIGGGVVLDVAGLAASLYRRGVPYVRVPTTLMAMVDASVGAKSAVNWSGRRNRIGAYHTPTAVYIDNEFIATQDAREVANGAGEILKMAVVRDRKLFEQLEASARMLIDSRFQCGEAANDVMDAAIGDMVEELAPNLWEIELERLVDFGHSFSPLVEMRALPELLHGEAVVLDVLFSCILAHGRGMLARDEVERVFATAQALGLPTFHPAFGDASTLAEALTDTMRHRNGAQNLPLPIAIGHAEFVNDLTGEEIESATRQFRARAGTR